MDINITDSNYLGYKRLLEFKTIHTKTFYDKRNKYVDYLLALLGLGLSIITFTSIPIIYSLPILSIAFKITGASIVVCISGKVIKNVTDYLEKKSFHNDYPNIDMNIPVYELEDALFKYYESKKENKKDKYMDNSRKIEYIERNENIQENILDKPKQLIKK